MKCSTMFVVLVVAIALGPSRSSAEWVTYHNDFNDGIGSDFSVSNAYGLFTVDTDGPAVRISKPEDDGTTKTNGFIQAGIVTNFHLVGDFTVTVDFSLDNLPIAFYPGLNESALSCALLPGDDTGGLGVDAFSLLHFTYSHVPQNQIEVWDGNAHGGRSSTALQGRYRIVRNGSNVAAYIDEGFSGSFSFVWQGIWLADDVQVRLLGVQGTNFINQPRSTTAIDISFDNLDIIAENIVVPEPSSFVLLLIGAFVSLIFRRR